MGFITRAWIENITSDKDESREEINKKLLLKCYEMKLDSKGNYYTRNIEEMLSTGVCGKLYGIEKEFAELAKNFPDILFEIHEEQDEASDGISDYYYWVYFFKGLKSYCEKAKIKVEYPEFNPDKMRNS